MDKLFLTILNMSLTGAFVIAAICLARLPLKKAPKIISYCLWAVAGFRLVVPFSIESVFSLIPFKAQTIPPDIAMQPVPRIDSGISFVNNAVGSILPAATPAASTNPLQIWIAIGAYVWFVGVSVMLVYGIASFVILKRKMKKASLVESGIYEAENIKSPFVLGIFKPRIYLPIGLNEREKSYIILHEQLHIKRHDHIVKLAAYFILCLHWFNPFTWVAFLLMGVDMEMSCDERVLKEMGSETIKDYSLSLLSLAAERRIIVGNPLAFGECGVKERIKNVLNFKKTPRVIIVAAVALVAVLSVGFAASRTQGSNSISAETAAAQLANSIEYATEEIRFQIPADYSETKNWNIHISGRAELEDGLSMSVHEFEDVNENHAWDAGKWYSISTEGRNLTELAMDIYLRDETGNMVERSVDLLVAIQDLYFDTVAKEREAEAALDLAVDDQGDYEKTASVWIYTWLDAFKSMPADNMAHIEDGAIDSLKVLMVAKDGLPKAVIFTVEVSVKPTYTIGQNSFWMAGNTGPSPGRDESWGQLYREIELRMESDGKFHLVEMGTGGVWGSSKDGYNFVEDDSLLNANPVSLQSQITVYLSDMFTEAYAPYYEGLRYEMFHYEEAIIDRNYMATFLWTMYHLGNGLDVPADLGKEQQANWSLLVTAKTSADGLLDTSTIVTLADSSVTGPPTYQIPLEEFFPNAEDGAIALIDSEPYSSAIDAAMAYYSNTVFAESVQSLKLIETSSEYSDYLDENKVKEEVVAFNVSMTNDPKSHPMRIIILTREKNGEWEVINEGY